MSRARTRSLKRKRDEDGGSEPDGYHSASEIDLFGDGNTKRQGKAKRTRGNESAVEPPASHPLRTSNSTQTAMKKSTNAVHPPLNTSHLSEDIYLSQDDIEGVDRSRRSGAVALKDKPSRDEKGQDQAPKPPSQSIFNAARMGKLDVVKSLIEEENEDPNITTCSNSPLHYAAKYGKLDVAEYLLSAGADINMVNASGITPLHWAVESGKVNVVRLLLENGAKANAKSKIGETPIFKAARNGNVDIVKVLYDFSADVNAALSEEKENNSLLHEAVASKSTAVVKFLIECGARLEAANHGGHTPLHLAAQKDLHEILQLLLESGAIVDVKDAQGRTPLHWACFFGFMKSAQILIQHGAYLSEKDMTGASPVDYANSRKYEELSRFLDSVKTTQPLRFDPLKIVFNRPQPVIPIRPTAQLPVVRTVEVPISKESERINLRSSKNNVSKAIEQLEPLAEVDVDALLF